MIIALTALRQLSTSQNEESISSPGDLVPASSCNDRTGFSIVWSCLTTIFACTWIAIHPNLPFNGERPLIRRLKIFFIALLAPELIISWAIRQWLASRCLAREYKEYGWTHTHAFFAIMGGFQICERDMSLRTLKPEEIEPYLKDGTIKISEEEILDRSKGDLLSKTLVFLQVSWFVLQFMARIAQELAITLLELVTLAYALSSFMIYFCWLNKPLNVDYPIKVYKQSDSPETLVISTDSSTPFSTTPIPGGDTDRSTSEIALGGNRGPSGHHIPPYSKQNTSFASFGPNARNRYDTASIISKISPQTPLIPDSKQRSTVDIELSPLLPVSNPLNFSGDDSRPTVNSKGDQDSQSSGDAVENFMDRLGSLLLGKDSEDGPYASGANFVDSGKLDSITLVCMVAAKFGAIHCLGWYFGFPTEAEKWLWRISSIAITLTPIFFLLYKYVAVEVEWRVESELEQSKRKLKTISFWTMKVLLFPTKYTLLFPSAIGIILYPFARMILLIQIFMLLRDPDLGIYTPIDWVTYIPHF